MFPITFYLLIIVINGWYCFNSDFYQPSMVGTVLGAVDYLLWVSGKN